MNQKRTHIYIYNTSCKCTLLYALSEKETPPLIMSEAQAR